MQHEQPCAHLDKQRRKRTCVCVYIYIYHVHLHIYVHLCKYVNVHTRKPGVMSVCVSPITEISDIHNPRQTSHNLSEIGMPVVPLINYKCRSACIHIFLYVFCMCACMYVCAYIYIYAHIYIYLQTTMHSRLRPVCMIVYVCTHTYVCVYKQTNKQTNIYIYAYVRPRTNLGCARLSPVRANVRAPAQTHTHEQRHRDGAHWLPRSPAWTTGLL